MEKLSIESIEGDNYLPLHGRNYKPRPEVRKKEPDVVLPDEWNEAVNQANEKDLQDLAGKSGTRGSCLVNSADVGRRGKTAFRNTIISFIKGILGIHSLLTQEQSSSSNAGEMRESLRELDEKKGRLHYGGADKNIHILLWSYCRCLKHEIMNLNLNKSL